MGVGNCFCGVTSASFLYQLEAVLSDFIDRYSKHVNWVRPTKSEHKSDKVVHKYITVKVLKESVRFQLDSGSDLSIMNLQTWRKLNRPIIKMTSKTVRTVTGDKIIISLTKTGDIPTPKGLQLSRICPPLIMLRHYRASLDLQTITEVS